MQKGRKKWLIALLAALAGAIPVLVPQAAPVSDMLVQTANVLVGSPAPRQASPRLRSLAARARATLEVCQGPSSKGICRACARLLQRMEQRDCFLADDESSTEEEAPSEAALDPGPGGDRKDHLSDDDGGDIFSQRLSLA